MAREPNVAVGPRRTALLSELSRLSIRIERLDLRLRQSPDDAAVAAELQMVESRLLELSEHFGGRSPWSPVTDAA